MWSIILFIQPIRTINTLFFPFLHHSDNYIFTKKLSKQFIQAQTNRIKNAIIQFEHPNRRHPTIIPAEFKNKTGKPA